MLATAKRARQIIDGKKPMSIPSINKPLSIAVDELNKGLLKIELRDEDEDEEETAVPEEILEEKESGETVEESAEVSAEE